MISEISEVSTCQQSSSIPSFVTKIVIVGDSGVGKTNILLRFTQNLYHSNHVATIGIDFKVKTLALPNNIKIKMQIWDTAGQQRFKTITQTFYRGTSGILLIFSITNRKSFENCRGWMKQIIECSEGRTPRIIVGNKVDAGDRREVAEEEGRALAEEYDALYMEVSAKENLGIEEVFVELGKMMVKAAGEQKKKNYKLILQEKLKSKNNKCC